MRLYKKNTIIKLIIGIISSSIFLILFINKNSIESGYKNIYLLPIAFLLTFYWGIGQLVFIKNTIGVKIIFITEILRYLILPFLIFKTSYYTGMGYNPNPKYIEIAIYLMVYEIFLVNLLAMIFKISSKNKFGLKNIVNYKNNDRIEKITCLFLILTILLLILKPNSISDINFILLKKNVEVSNDFITTLTRILFIISKNLIYLLCTIKLSEKYKKSKKIRFLNLGYLITFLNISIYLNDNRANLLMFGVASLFVLINVFPEYKERTVKFIIISILFLIIIVTLTKNFGVELNNLGNNKSIDLQKITKTLQAYVAGPRNIAQSIEMGNIYNGYINLKMLISDLFRSFLGLSKLVSSISYYSTVNLFNIYIYGSSISKDQIIPILGQGYVYFNMFLSPLFLLIFNYISMNIDLKLSNEQNLINIYFYTLLSCATGLASIYNLNIEIQLITITILPTFLILLVNRKFVLKR